MGAQSFDVIVIGAGPAGISGAQTAALMGARTLLIERESEVGGAGINTGTIPSKTLRETALALSGIRSRRLHGVDLSLRREASISDFTRHRDNVMRGERQRAEGRLDRLGVQRCTGTAKFRDSHTVLVDCADGGVREFGGGLILIATGSSPFRPAEFPFEDAHVHDSDEILAIGRLPRALAVVGAGVIGCEYASTFAALGTTVHLIDGRGSLLPFLDREISTALAGAMSASGIELHLGERVQQCHVDAGAANAAGNITLRLASGIDLRCDDVLVCSGRTSNTEGMDLKAAGVATGKRGLIEVDADFRTTTPNIYAAGDAIGAPALAATGMEQARAAVSRALGSTLKGDLATLLPAGIYTIPEIGAAGATEEALREAGVDYVAGRWLAKDSPRGCILGDEHGMLKLLFRRSDLRLLGVHVIGEQATETVHVGMIAMLADGDADLFNRACFNFPTLGDLYKYATYDALFQIRERA
ncbi:MAG: Si-specific NAD(P)(+) transhydrogenase [Pseudoxanthomonas sp.]